MKMHTMILAAFTAMLLAVTASAETHIDVTTFEPTPPTKRVIPDDEIDDGPGFKAALKYIIDNGGGTLEVPAGNYHIDKTVVVDLKNPANSAAVTVTIQGHGRGVTQIHSRTTDELFFFNNTLGNSQLGVYDLSFLAAREKCGAAIRFKNLALCPGAPDFHSLSMSAVNFQAEDWRNPTTVFYFQFGVNAACVHQPVFDDVNFSNRLGTRGEEGEDPIYVGVAGFRIINGRGATFTNCYSKQVGRGIDLSSMSGDILLDRVTATGGDYGLFFTTANFLTSNVTVLDTQWNHSINGMKVHGANKVTVKNLAAYHHCDNPRADKYYYDIYVQNCTELVVSESVFHKRDSQYRVNICFNNTPTVAVRNNIFNCNNRDKNPNPPVVAVRMDDDVYDVLENPEEGDPKNLFFDGSDQVQENDPDPADLPPGVTITHNIYNKNGTN